MQRELILIAVFFGAWVVLPDADGRICQSVDVKRFVDNFEKLRNCTIIMGHLHFAVFENNVTHHELAQHTFPELTEIAEYLLVFRVMHLKSLGKVFPNLRIIRGTKLYQNYAMVVYRNPDLEEIGLTNLRHIGRGAVKIDHCPNLCFGDTVNWEALGATDVDIRKSVNNTRICHNKYCPSECRENCWNTATCQKLPVSDTCHSQCIGCTMDNSPKHCHSCKYFEKEGECVESCPTSSVTNYYSMKCITAEECRTIMNGTWWVFNNTCIQHCPLYYERSKESEGGCAFVGDNYKQLCNGSVIDNIAEMEKFATCTHINGSLEIRVSLSYLEQFLEKNLGRIVSIRGNLKIRRSSAVKSLEFFKKLTVIEGQELENDKYAFIVLDNQNLQRLWNWTDNFNLTIKRGTISFHDNPQLCLSEIEKLANLTGVTNTTEMEISQYSNGYRAACNVKNVDVRVERNSTNVTLTWDWDTPDTQEANDTKATQYTIIGYTIHYVVAMKVNVTTFENKDACNTESWDSVFVSSNTVQLKLLAPYTRYGYFIKALSTSLRSEQTPVYYFYTKSEDPSEPADFIAKAKDESTIVLSWLPPKLTNGKLAYYLITMYLQEDYISTIEERDYCRHPYSDSTKGVQVYTTPKTVSPDCPCLEDNNHWVFKKDSVCATNDDCKKFFYYTVSDKLTVNNTNTETLKNITKRSAPTQVITLDNLNQTFRHINESAANLSMYEFTNLRHFSVYIFFLLACNEPEGDKELCSSPEMVFARTNRSESADNVETFSVTVNEKDVAIAWSDPKKINSAIVSYQVEVKRTDLEHSKPADECITRKQYRKTGSQYQLLGLTPGKYAVRIRASSLAGPGKFSAWKPFEISPPQSGMYWIYTLMGFVAVMFVALAAYIGRYWYRKKYAFNSNHLITSINPDYAGPIYEEDDWELDRKDIEIVKELGHGSFGMVYQGMIKSKRYPCAIKTVNESASMPSRMEFLNEGAVMKAFDTPHVIKLLGIVSRGQPPLVIMELMERGDLKSYLRRCREPSQNLTTNEIYRMAAEIADGMAYLTAKKFVHRDLAARNCMVAADRTVKIGDFGMARDIYETDYYRKETVGLLPVRWMAPESLADGVFTSDSDVWSYGIVLWEMATLAEQPYQGFSNEEVFHHVKNKGRLERPPECSDLLFEIMDACWVWRPNNRPTFADIVDKLVDHVGQDFRLVAFCYSRQGRELALNAGPRVYNAPAMIVAPEEDFFGRYDASEEEVSLYVKEPSRPSKFLPLSSQRYNKSSPYQISPGSPSSTFSLNSS